MDEEKEIKEEPAVTDTDEGSESETDKQTAKLSAENERLEKQVKKREELIARNKAAIATKELGGVTEAGTKPPEKKKMTDTEYAEALQRGEVNPLKEDGFI